MAPPNRNMPMARSRAPPPGNSSLSQRRPVPALEMLKADARKQAKGARPISNLLAQLEDFTVEMSPPPTVQDSRKQDFFNSDRSDASPDGDDDNEFESGLLADLEALLPGRGKGNSKPRIAPRSRSASSSSSKASNASLPSSTSSSRINTRPSIETQASPRNRPAGKTGLVAPPRRVISPLSSALSPSPAEESSNPTAKSTIAPRTSSAGQTALPESLLQAILSTNISDPFAKNTGDMTKGQSNDDDLFMPGDKRLSAFTITTTSSVGDVADGIMMQIMLQEATIEATGFSVLTSEKYEKRKEEMKSLLTKLKSLQTRLRLETRTRDPTSSLTRSRPSGSKVDTITADMWKCLEQVLHTERTVFKHMAGVLRWGVTKDKEGAVNGTMSSTGDSSIPDMGQKLASAETRIKEYERENAALKTAVARLENEQEPLRKLAADARREVRLTRAVPDSGRSISDSDYKQLKLEVDSLNSELAAARDNLANLQLQLEDNVTLIEAKDRAIADLLAENEEITNQLNKPEVKAATAAEGVNTLSRKSPRTSVWIREQILKQIETQSESMRATLGAQLKEAVLERERLKLELGEQIEINKELRGKIGEIQQDGANSNSSSGRPNDDSDTETEDDAPKRPTFRNLRNAGRKPSMASLKSDSSSESKVAQQESLISDLQRQIKKNGEAMALSEEEKEKLRRLYSEVKAARRRNDTLGSAAFTIDVLVGSVQDILKDRADLAAEVQGLQKHVAKMTDNDESQGTELRAALRKAENHQREIEELRGRYESQIAGIEEELAAKEGVIRDLEAGLSSSQNLASEQADLQRQVSMLEEQLVDQAKSLEDKYRKKEDSLRQTHREETDSLNDELIAARQEGRELRRRAEETEKRLGESLERIDVLTREQEEAEKRYQEESQRLRSEHDNEVNKLNEELTALTKELVSTSDTDAIETLKEEHEEAIQELRQQYEAELSQLKEEVEQMVSRLEMSETALVTSKQRYFQERERMQERIDEAQEARDRIDAELREEQAKAEKEIEQVQSELQNVMTRMRMTEADLAKAQKRAEEAETEANAMVADLERLRIAVDTKESEVTRLHGSLDEKEQQLQEALSISAEINGIQEMLESKESEVQVAKKEAERAKEELTEYKASMAAKEKEYSEGFQLVETMQTMVMDLKRNKASMLEEIDDCKYREEVMRRQVNNLEKELAKLSSAAKEFQAEKASYEEMMSKQKEELDALQAKVQEQSIEKLGVSSDGSSSASAMRAEFRKLVAEIRDENSRKLAKEVAARQGVEAELKKLKREKEMGSYKATV